MTDIIQKIGLSSGARFLAEGERSSINFLTTTRRREYGNLHCDMPDLVNNVDTDEIVRGILALCPTPRDPLSLKDGVLGVEGNNVPFELSTQEVRPCFHLHYRSHTHPPKSLALN